MTATAALTPAQLRLHADQEIRAIAAELKLIAERGYAHGPLMPDAERIDRLAAILRRGYLDETLDLSERLARARGDLIAASVHELIAKGSTRGQAVATLMLQLNVDSRTSVTRPLMLAEIRHGLPRAKYVLRKPRPLKAVK